MPVTHGNRLRAASSPDSETLSLTVCARSAPALRRPCAGFVQRMLTSQEIPRTLRKPGSPPAARAASRTGYGLCIHVSSSACCAVLQNCGCSSELLRGLRLDTDTACSAASTERSRYLPDARPCSGDCGGACQVPGIALPPGIPVVQRRAAARAARTRVVGGSHPRALSCARRCPREQYASTQGRGKLFSGESP